MGVLIDLSVSELSCICIQWEIGENLFLPLSSRDLSDLSTDLSDSMGSVRRVRKGRGEKRVEVESLRASQVMSE